MQLLEASKAVATVLICSVAAPRQWSLPPTFFVIRPGRAASTQVCTLPVFLTLIHGLVTRCSTIHACALTQVIVGHIVSTLIARVN